MEVLNQLNQTEKSPILFDLPRQSSITDTTVDGDFRVVDAPDDDDSGDGTSQINQEDEEKEKVTSIRREENADTSPEEKVYKCPNCFFESTTHLLHILHTCKPLKAQVFTVTYNKEGNIFSCTCDYVYHTLKSFHEHLVSHIIAKPFRCSLCKDMFSTRKETVKHLIDAHPECKMRFYVNGLKYTAGILEKARKDGSYTHKFGEKPVTSQTSTAISNIVQTTIPLDRKLDQKAKCSPLPSTSSQPDPPAPAKSRETPVPFELFKNMSHREMFKFLFSSTGVKYACTVCAKEWESRSTFCFHIWNHQHEMGKKCGDCDQKNGETGVTCMVTIRLFRKLAFASFTKTKMRAEKNGALKNLTLNQIAFGLNSVNTYKCLACNLTLPQLSNLKWHIWQHSHSSIICPACSIMGGGETRYIVCPLVEKLVGRLKLKEDAQEKAALENTETLKFNSTGGAKKFDTIYKGSQIVFVCYMCCKQWTDQVRFWLHAWNHVHNDKKKCVHCKEIYVFPHMSCTIVDNAINFPHHKQAQVNPPCDETISLEEDLIITTTEPAYRPQTEHDIIIIEDTPGPADLSKYLTTELTVSIKTEDEDCDTGEGDDEAEITIEYADAACADLSFSDSPTSSKSSVAAMDTSSVSNITIQRPDKELPTLTKEDIEQSNFPTGLRCDFLSSEPVCKAIACFLTRTNQEYICLICTATFPLNELIQTHEHLIVKHMKIPLLQCGHCYFNANEDYQVSNHCRLKHPGDEVTVIGYDIDINKSVEQYICLTKFKRPERLGQILPKTNTNAEDNTDKSLQEHITGPEIIVNEVQRGSDVNIFIKMESIKSTAVPVKFEVCSADDAFDDESKISPSGPQILSTYSLADNGTNMDNYGQSNTPDVQKQESFRHLGCSPKGSYFSNKFYSCGLCDYATLIKEDFRKHLFTQHSAQKQFPCMHCGFVGLRTDALMKHFAYHKNNNSPSIPVFQCIETDCEFRCNLLSAFVTHLKEHNLTKFECHECAVEMLNFAELKLHYQMNLLFIICCPHCSAVATDQQTLLDHINLWHDERPEVYTVGKHLVCRDRQLYGYFFKPTFTNTPAMDQAVGSSDSRRDTIQEPKVVELCCKHCSYYAISAGKLVEHEEVHSTVQDDMPFICPFCQSPFIKEKLLEDHLLGHAEKQISFFYFQCKQDDFCTNIYSKMFEHIHNGQHILPKNPDDLFTKQEISLKSRVICCPMDPCTFKSICRRYLTCHIQTVHQSPRPSPSDMHGTTASDDISSSEAVSVPTKLYKCPESICSYSTYNGKDFEEHVQTHQKLQSDDQSTPFSDINKYKKDFHIYIPTDGPENQEKLSLLAKRMRKLYSKDKDNYKCKVCNHCKKNVLALVKHILVHLKLSYRCYMCDFTNRMVWRMLKHAKKEHNCGHYNIIYSDKLEEVSLQLLQPQQESSKLGNKTATKCQKRPIAQKRGNRGGSLRNGEHSVRGEKTSNEGTSANTTSTIKSDQISKSTKIKERTDSSHLPTKETLHRTSQQKEQMSTRIQSLSTVQDNTAAKEEDRNDYVENNFDNASAGSQTATHEQSPKKLNTVKEDKENPVISLIQWSTLVSKKNMCLLGSDYLDSSLSVLYSTQNNKHQCKICKHMFASISRYWIHHHLNLHHLQMNLYQCGYCEFRAIEKFKIHEHIAKKHPNHTVTVNDIDVNVNHVVYNFIKKNRLDVKLDMHINAPEKVEMGTGGFIPEKIACEPTVPGSTKADGQKLFRCEHCSETFQYEIKVKMHSNTVHADKESLIKIVYQKSTDSPVVQNSAGESQPKSLKRKSSEVDHGTIKKANKESPENVYKCPQCDFTTDCNLDAMASHFRSHNYEKILECFYCQVRSFDDKSNKKHHRLLHQLEIENFKLLPIVKFFKIIKAASAPTPLTVSTSNDTFKFVCNFCGLRSNKKNIMREHLYQHLPHLHPCIICSVCSKPIFDPKTRREHFMQTHKSITNSRHFSKIEEDLNKALIVCSGVDDSQDCTVRPKRVSANANTSPVNNFKCVQCPRVYKCLDDVGRHNRQAHNTSGNLSTYWKDAVTGGVYNLHGLMSGDKVSLSRHKVFLCKFCDYRGHVSGALSHHMVKKHNGKKLTRTIELHYPETEAASELATSKTKRKGELGFCCSVCSNVSTSMYKFREHLGEHIRVFKKLTPSLKDKQLLRCRLCGCNFESANRFSVHIEKHITQKQFTCAHCVFESHQCTVVKLHVQKAHPNKRMDHAVVDLKSPQTGILVDFDASVRLKNFFEMLPSEFENLLNSENIQDVDLSRVPLEIAEKLLLAY